MSSDSGSSGFSPLVRVEIFSSIDYYRPINNYCVPLNIIVFDNCESEKFSSGSIDTETSFNEFSFDTLLYDEDVGRDHTLNFAPALSLVVFL